MKFARGSQEKVAHFDGDPPLSILVLEIPTFTDFKKNMVISCRVVSVIEGDNR